jgi:hypothetical protein
MPNLSTCFKTHDTPEKLKLKIMERVFSLKGDKDGNLQHLPAVMAMIKDAEDRRAVLVGKIEAAGGVVENSLISSGNGPTVKEKGGIDNEKIREHVPGNDGGLPQGEEPAGIEPAGVGGETDGVSGGRAGLVRGSGSNDISADDNGPSGEAIAEDAEDKPSEISSSGSDGKGLDRVPSGPRNYRITDQDSLGKGGAKAKAKANIKAIQILKKLQASGRPANAEQQAALVKYTGWGSSELANGMFPKRQYDRDKRDYVDVYKEGWQELGEKLKSLLSPKEYAEAQGSTLNAHYTSREVVAAIYRALERFGYKGNGRILNRVQVSAAS